MAKRHPALIPLSHDHHHGLALALRCRKHALGQLNPGDPASIEACAAEASRFFNENLTAHFEAEETVLFPLMAAYEECRELVANSKSEHREFRKMVARLADPGGPRKSLFDFGGPAGAAHPERRSGGSSPPSRPSCRRRRPSGPGGKSSDCWSWNQGQTTRSGAGAHHAMNTKTAIISIGDLTDAAVPGLTKAFENAPGVTEVDFSVERKVAVVEFDPDTTSVDALMRVVLAQGYKVL